MRHACPAVVKTHHAPLASSRAAPGAPAQKPLPLPSGGAMTVAYGDVLRRYDETGGSSRLPPGIASSPAHMQPPSPERCDWRGPMVRHKRGLALLDQFIVIHWFSPIQKWELLRRFFFIQPNVSRFYVDMHFYATFFACQDQKWSLYGPQRRRKKRHFYVQTKPQLI